VSFTPEEVTLLNLAGAVWREGSLSSESHRALLKLASLGIAVEEPTIGYAPRVRVREPAFAALTSAIDRQLVVKFPYFKPGESAALQRTVAPLALVQHQGRWHLASIDQDRGVPRTFLLSRIVGPVTVTRTSFERPDDATDPAAAALAELDRVLRTNSVVVTVEPGSDAESRFAPRATTVVEGANGGPAEYTHHYADAVLMADELATYGPEVRVVRPAAMRAAVTKRLRAVATTHEAATVPAAPARRAPAARTRRAAVGTADASSTGTVRAEDEVGE
jgi:proteasome accessory factor B